MSDELLPHRQAIDAIDAEIMRLLNARAAHAQAIGHIKGGVDIYRPEREAQVLRRVREANPGPLPGDAVVRLFREIMSACLALEKPLTVAYLGPAGTYSEAAAVKHFGQAARTAACDSIDAAVREVETGTADFAVVPVENSTEGAVNRTLDLLQKTTLKICGEVNLPIHHCLMAAAAVDPAAARKVFSHPQSLAQCRGWLDAHLPGAERLAVSSNAEAARLAAENPGAVAIAGERAAQLYDLALLARNIEDEPGNTTRFLVLGAQETGPSGQDRTSLLVTAPNRPGAIYAILSPLAAHGVSMSKLESRPTRNQLGEYVFFIDVEGHLADAPVAAALDEMRAQAVFLKVLGSYPATAL